jgi:predicted MFS family arabinose efflux permease
VNDAPTHRTLLLLSFAAFFGAAALRVCDPLLPRFASEFAVSAGTAGQVVIGFAIAYGVLQLVFGPLGDRYGKLRLVRLALFGCGIGSGAAALSGHFDALVVLRAAWGMCAAGVIPLSMAWIGDTVPYEQRQATLARFLTGTLSGMVAGTLLGGLFADSALGWRGAFGVLAAGYLAVAFALGAAVRAEPPADAARAMHPLASLAEVLRTPWARVVLLAVAAEGVFMLSALAFIPSYLHARFGLSLALAAALAACYALGGLAYTAVARRLVMRWGERGMVWRGGWLVGAGFLGLWLAPHWALSVPAILLIGFGAYLFHATLQTHATQMAPRARGSAVALFACCLFGGQAAGTSGAAALVDHAGFVPLLLCAAVGLAAAGSAFASALARRR